MARDLAPLLAAGYRIEEAHLFDLFPQTFHIESVMLLEHGRSSSVGGR
jgi:23S rRNA (uracil1939-C5)-methyltransferase